MKTIASAAAVAAVFVGSAAAQGARAPDSADPSAGVPAPAYRSAFDGLPSGVEQEPVDWRQANADVAQFPRGHADYVKWEEQQRGAAPAAASPSPAPAGPAVPAPRPPGHQQH